MSEIKKCPNGHYYQGDECPYCHINSNNRKSITIGRDIHNDCVIIDPFVSRIHCKIEEIGNNRYRLIELAESGTLVNGKRVNDSMEIGPLDVIMVGHTCVDWLHYFSGAYGLRYGDDQGWPHLTGIILPSEDKNDDKKEIK